MKLPYRAQTSMGDVFDVEFPLHRETRDPVRVGQLVTAVLEAIDRDIGFADETGNGDVLQAMAMAMAIRARMIHAPRGVADALATDLLGSALDATSQTPRVSQPAGHA